MPEYLAPGVYVEEKSFRSKSIEGVSTTTTGFVGPTRYGPTEGEAELITSFTQFERIYGGLDPLDYGNGDVTNYMAHAVRAFFDNGGSRLYIARTYTKPDAGDGRAVAVIPAPSAAIEEANTQSINATAETQAALNDVIIAAQQSTAAAITVLRYGFNQFAARIREINNAPNLPMINFDYGAGPNVTSQITNFITSIVQDQNQPDPNQVTTQNAVRGAFNALRIDPNLEDSNLIRLADAVYALAQGSLQNAKTSGDGVRNARSQGQQDGSSDVISDAALLNAPEPRAIAALAVLSSLIAYVKQKVNELPDLKDALNEAISELKDIASAGLVVTAAGKLTEAAREVVTAANNSVSAIAEAVTASTIGSRVAIRNAKAKFLARFPGILGNMTVHITGRLAANVLDVDRDNKLTVNLLHGDLVVIERQGNAFIYSASNINGTWSFEHETGTSLALDRLNPLNDRVYPLALTVEVEIPGKFPHSLLWDNLTVTRDPSRQRDNLIQVFASNIRNRLQELETPLELDAGNLQVAQLAGYLIGLTDWQTKLHPPDPLLNPSNSDRDKFTISQRFYLKDGNDGKYPAHKAYEGDENISTGIKSGLKSFEDLEDISIIAAPGYSHNSRDQEDVKQISQYLMSHCENMRYRVAILDSPDSQAVSDVRQYKALLDSTRVALYYPWICILDPITNQQINVPPSGFIAGIYARNDVEIGVHKAPANEVVRGAIGLETTINKAQQDVLNPLGINCIRFFENRGIRVWGARTASSDPEWKYLNIRRYFVYLERSIERSTQWAVFEPNGDQLWANVRRSVESFLENEWKEGRLAGTKVEEAFFVRCDRSTMTQNDIDNGRMICLIGVAPLYPAEFVIFRIGQWTANARR